MGKKILHIGIFVYLLFNGINSFGQQVSIIAPSSVCRGKTFTLTIHSNVPISFELQKSDIPPFTNWSSQGQTQTQWNGVDYTSTLYPAITKTTRYRIWYTTDPSFDPSSPSFANPSPVYYPSNTDAQIEITLYSTPLVSSFTASPTCSGSPFEVTPLPTDGSGNTVSALYTWLQPVVTGGMTGGASTNVVSATISGTLTNPTISTQSATYTVTPISSIGNCPGTPFTVTVPINPSPQINNLQVSICSGDAYTLTPTNVSDGVVPNGTNYAWSNPVLTGSSGSISGGTSGSGSSITATLVNTTSSTQTATYTIVPSLSNGCTGSSFTVTVNLKPRPNIANNNPREICSNNAFTFTPLITDIVPVGTKYTWSVGINANVTGQSDVLTPTTSFSQVLTGNSSTQTLTYTVTPIVDGCSGSTFNSIVTIIANPLINSKSFQICSGGGVNFTPMNGNDGIVPANTMYTWTTDNNPNVNGFDSNSTPTGSIFDSNLVNATLTDQNVIYTVTSSASNGCAATTFTVTAIIVPKAIINNKILNGSNAICSGNSFSVTPGVMYGDIVVPGTNYTWTVLANPNTSGQSGVSTPTSPISQVITNLTNEPKEVIYNVTSTSTGTCAPATFSITVIVNPTPTISDHAIDICSNNDFIFNPNTINGNIVPSGTIYSWTYMPNGNIAGQTSGTYTATLGLISQGVLTNISSAIQTSTYSVNPRVTINGKVCTGSSFNIPLTINPLPYIQPITATAICSGGSMTISPTDGSGNIVPNNTQFSWVYSVNQNITGQTTNNNQNNIFQASLNNLTKDPQTILFSVTPFTTNCSGSSFTITQVVNPVATIASSTISTCSGIAFISEPGLPNIIPDNTSYTWSIASSTVSGTSNQLVAQPSISQLLTNNTNTLKSANYIITPRPQNGCASASYTLTVDVNPTPKIATQSISDICSGAGFTFTPTNGGIAGDIVPSLTTYTWVTPANTYLSGISNVISAQNNIAQVPVNLTSSIRSLSYTVTATSNMGCAGVPFGLGMNIKPTATIGLKNANPICSGNTFSVPLIDGQSNDIIPDLTKYTWTVANDPKITGDVDQTVPQTNVFQSLSSSSNTPAQLTYSVLPILSNNCPSNTFTVTVTVNPLPTGSINVTETSGLNNNDRVICSNETATFTANPTVGLLTDYDYTWAVPVLANAQGNTSSFNSSVAGTYSLSFTNKSTGCISATQTSTILTVYSIPLAGDITGPNNVCVNSDIMLNAHPSLGAGSYRYYYWYDNNELAAPPFSSSSVVVTGRNPGNSVITYKVQDNLNCYSEMSNGFNFQVNALPSDPIANSIDQPYDGITHTGSALASNPSAEQIDWYLNSSDATTSTAPSARDYTPTPVKSYAVARNSTTSCISVNRVEVFVKINKKALSITANDVQKTYDKSPFTGPNSVSYNGFVSGESQSNLSNSLTFGGSAINAINAGTYVIEPSGYTSNNYAISYVAGKLTINKLGLTITGANVLSKTYDASDNATMNAGSLVGLIAGDNVDLNYSAKFPSKNVGTNLPITSTSTISGSAASNYTLDPTINVTASISPKQIDAIGLVTSDKIYDGTNSASVTGGGFNAAIDPGTGNSSDRIPYKNDNIQLVPSGNFVNKDVGNNITITSTSTITGADANNYTLVQPNLTARNITPKALTMAGLSVAAPKIYDGTTVAVVTGTPALLATETPGTGTVNDGKPYNNDIVSIAGTPIGTYNSKDVLTANAVSFSGLSLSGTNANNYTLTIQSPYASSILRKALSMFGLSVPSTKVYDGNTTAIVGGIPNLYNAVSTNIATASDGYPIIGDDVSIVGTPIGTYNSKDVISATYVAYSGLDLAGNQASNYSLNTQSNSAATITPLDINVKANAQTKVYGEQDPYFTFINDPLIGDDSFMGSLERTTGESAGTYAINQGTLVLSPNYTIKFTSNTLTILKAEVVIQPNLVERTYGDQPLLPNATTSNFTATGLKNNETISSISIKLPEGLNSGNGFKDSAGTYEGVVFASNPIPENIDLNNYKISFKAGNIVVKKYTLTISAESKEKRKTQVDPPFTYVVSRPLVEGDSLVGQLSRESGEEVGFYKILQGSVYVNNNYDIKYLPAFLEILTIERVIVVPNAFTPNNDGLNDVIKIIRNSTITSINYFKIFDRSGKQIFETKNINEGWDGKLNGAVAESDAYYWMAEYNTWDNKIFQVKGSFVLIK